MWVPAKAPVRAPAKALAKVPAMARAKARERAAPAADDVRLGDRVVDPVIAGRQDGDAPNVATLSSRVWALDRLLVRPGNEAGSPAVACGWVVVGRDRCRAGREGEPGAGYGAEVPVAPMPRDVAIAVAPAVSGIDMMAETAIAAP